MCVFASLRLLDKVPAERDGVGECVVEKERNMELESESESDPPAPEIEIVGEMRVAVVRVKDKEANHEYVSEGVTDPEGDIDEE